MNHKYYLKPCPFCGGEGAGIQDHHGYYSVTCGYYNDATSSKHCFQDWGKFETEEDAIKAWNRREIENTSKICENCEWIGRAGDCCNSESKYNGFLMRPADFCKMWAKKNFK